MKKLIILLVAISLVLIGIETVNAGWTITTNAKSRTYSSCVLTVIASTSNTPARTNYLLSKGFLKGKSVPTWVFFSVETNGNSGSNEAGNSTPFVRSINATNIIFGRTIPTVDPSAYIRFYIYILKPSPNVK